MSLKRLLVLGMVMMVILAACDNNEEEPANEPTTDNSEEENYTSDNSNSADNLIREVKKERGWINTSGNFREDSDYVTTDFIEYDPSSEYEITIGSYISYYNDEKFIKTVLHNSAGIIEGVDEANNIRLSYQERYDDRIILQEE